MFIVIKNKIVYNLIVLIGGNMFVNFIQGFCMALADSVPGVSGGTIAFLMGFYDKFINSLNNLISGNKKERIEALKFLFKLGIGWVVGMILAISILASVFDKGIYKVSSLFLGFIISSIPLMIMEEKNVLKGKYYNLFYALLGALAVIMLSVFKFGSSIDVSNLSIGMILYVLVAGMLAISAMVLPGISGSTVLLTFGLYVSIITAVKEVLSFDFSNLILLIIFGLGVILGIIVSLKGIKKVLKKYRSATIYAVIGMMIGSLYAIVMGPTTLEVPKEMMSFETFEVLFFVIGIVIVFGLEKIKKLPWYQKES